MDGNKEVAKHTTKPAKMLAPLADAGDEGAGGAGGDAAAEVATEAVSAAEGLGGAELPHLALLHPHKHVDFVKLPPSWLRSAALWWLRR